MWLRSLQGQMMLAIALALLIAQGFSATLIWHEVHQRHIAMLVNGAAMRMAMANDRANGLHPPGTDGGFDPHGPADARSPPGPPPVPPPGPSDDTLRLPRVLRVHIDPASPVQAGDRPLSEVETALRDALVAQGESPGSLIVVERDDMHDPLLRPMLPELRVRYRLTATDVLPALVIASQRQADGTWLTVRSFMPSNETQLLLRLLRQAILTYLVLVTVVGLILRRITRP